MVKKHWAERKSGSLWLAVQIVKNPCLKPQKYDVPKIAIDRLNNLKKNFHLLTKIIGLLKGLSWELNFKELTKLSKEHSETTRVNNKVVVCKK